MPLQLSDRSGPRVASRTKACPGLLATALSCALLAALPARALAADDCHVGAYRLSDGGRVDISTADNDALRWRRFDGSTGLLRRAADGHWTSTYGWTGRPDGKTVSFSDCAVGDIRFGSQAGHRLTFEVRDTRFTSHGVTLVGRLVLPVGSGPAPIVVLIHGSEHDSALINYDYQRMFPADGIGVFVYDKRGTGVSGGEYTQDFNLLADDAVAAMREARRLAGPRAGRIGYQGGSEGGWVAPLAANRAPVDFVIVSFGLAVSVADEDQEAVEIEMREKGHSPAEIAKAQQVARAAEEVFASGFTRGFAAFDAIRAKYRNEPWYKDLHGDFTWMLLPNSEAKLREMAPQFLWHTPVYWDPMKSLASATTPQLWVVGGEDYEAPSAVTRRRIGSLIDTGRPFTLAYYPKAEHGMTLFETSPDGERLSTRYAPGYFEMMEDFIRDGAVTGPYGDAVLTRRRSR
jgi:dienelactone hydrolase